MRGYIEQVNLIKGQALVVGGRKAFSDELPVGEGWHRLYVRVGIVVVIGTGSGAISEGELNFIKNVQLRTDRGEFICNVPGRALYKLAHIKSGSAPDKDAIAAASATYYVNLPIFFTEPERLGFPRNEDTILDTRRYTSLTLEVQLGTVADLFTTVGTSSATATIDVDVIRVKGPLPEKAQPFAHTYLDVRPPVDASSVVQILMERSADLAVKRFLFFVGTSGTAGVPFSGTASNAVIDQLNIKDQSGFIMKDRIWRMIQQDNKDYFSIETMPTGVAVIDFVQDRSNFSALMTGGKSLLQATWTNQSAPGANTIVTCLTEGVRLLK